MEIRIDGSRVDNGMFGYPAMGFGEHPKERRVHEFELQFSVDEFRQLMQSHFDKFANENKADDEKTNFSAAIQDLQQSNYADFEKMFHSSPSVLFRLIKRYLFIELLESTCSDVDDTKCEYVASSIAEVFSLAGRVVVRGNAYDIVRI